MLFSLIYWSSFSFFLDVLKYFMFEDLVRRQSNIIYKLTSMLKELGGLNVYGIMYGVQEGGCACRGGYVTIRDYLEEIGSPRPPCVSWELNSSRWA